MAIAYNLANNSIAPRLHISCGVDTRKKLIRFCWKFASKIGAHVQLPAWTPSRENGVMTVSMLAKIRRLHFRDASRFDTPEEVGGKQRPYVVRARDFGIDEKLVSGALVD